MQRQTTGAWGRLRGALALAQARALERGGGRRRFLNAPADTHGAPGLLPQTVEMKFDNSDINWLCINTVRCLAVDMVQKANSGHPGTVSDTDAPPCGVHA